MPVADNGEVRITWDTTVYKDKQLKHNRPDITLGYKETQKWTLIDIAVPADQNIVRTEEEKVERYQDLAFEIKRIFGASKMTVKLIVIGALGTISKNAKTWYGKLDLPDKIGSAPVVGHPQNYSCVAESVVSLSCGELLGNELEDTEERQRTG